MTKNRPVFTARLTRDRSQRLDVLAALTGETKNALFNRALEDLLLKHGIHPVTLSIVPPIEVADEKAS